MARGVLTALLVIGIGLVGYLGYRKFSSDEVAHPGQNNETVQPAELPLMHEGARRIGPVEEPLPAEPVKTAETPAIAQNTPVKTQQQPLRTPERPAPMDNAVASAEIRKAGALIEQGGADNLFKAREILTPVLLASPEGTGRANVKKMLDDINATLFFSPSPSPDSTRYVVKPGDSLWVIQNRVNRSVELIKLVNRKRNDNIQVNESLKIPVGDFSALAQRKHFRIILFLDGHYIKEYPIAIGENDLTPAGEFIIKNKIRNPSWTSPEGKFLAYGDPENPLGTRWLGFEDVGDRTGLGIHGTNDDKMIGTKGTNGCIRLYNRDAEEVFGMLRVGNKVIIE